ncbi:MAG: GTP 3',8-cyclase MoaA, partial [Candidatus Hydrothermarchaeota archaeon]
LACIYCHREGINKGEREMTSQEIERVVRLCARFGVKKVKLTGGEPLLRPDVSEIVSRIAGVDGIKDVSMTTNGVLLEEHAAALKEAGLDRINVSLDTLRPETFQEITRGGELARVLKGIDKALEVGLRPVKLNMVVMKGINEKEVKDLLRFASREGLVLQLIELMDAEREFFQRYFYNLDSLEREFEEGAEEVLVRGLMQGRRKYTLHGTEVEVIKPMHNTEFCAHCTRIRVTADGKFKPCLMRTDNTVDFLSLIRGGAPEAELERAFLEAVNKREPYFRGKGEMRRICSAEFE